MTRPAQTLQIAVSISAAMRFRDNVVNGFRLTHHTGTQAQLAQAFVTLQDTRADTVPLRTVAALMTGLSRFVLLPAFAFVLFTAARWIYSCFAAPSDPAGFRSSWWHNFYLLYDFEKGNYMNQEIITELEKEIDELKLETSANRVMIKIIMKYISNTSGMDVNTIFQEVVEAIAPNDISPENTPEEIERLQQYKEKILSFGHE